MIDMMIQQGEEDPWSLTNPSCGNIWSMDPRLNNDFLINRILKVYISYVSRGNGQRCSTFSPPTDFLLEAIHTYTHGLMEQHVWVGFCAQAHSDMQPEAGVKPPTFQLVDALLCLLRQELSLSWRTHSLQEHGSSGSSYVFFFFFFQHARVYQKICAWKWSLAFHVTIVQAAVSVFIYKLCHWHKKIITHCRKSCFKKTACHQWSYLSTQQDHFTSREILE